MAHRRSQSCADQADRGRAARTAAATHTVALVGAILLGLTSVHPAWSSPPVDSGSRTIAGPGPALSLGEGWHRLDGRLRVDGLDSLAGATLDDALARLNLRPEELGFDKLYADDDTFRLAIVEDLLNDPLRLPGWQQAVYRRIRSEAKHAPVLAQSLCALMEASMPATSSFRASVATGAPARVAAGEAARGRVGTASLDAAVEEFIRDCRVVETSLESAFAAWTPSDRERVLMLAPGFWGDGEDPLDQARKGALHFEGGVAIDTTLKASEDPILDAALLLDRPALTEATIRFFAAVERLEERAAHVLAETPAPTPPAPGSLPDVVGAVIGQYDTPWGLLVVGGRGNNEYGPEALRRIAFIVEPGGDDVYRGRAASAVGDLLRPMSAVIDLDGDDLYDAGSRAYALGGAVLGVAALIDRSGNDTYRADDGSLGAGFFGGGLLRDGGGRDLFEGRNLCQGAGAFGIGLLISDAPDEAPPGPERDEDRAFTLGLVKVPGTGAVPIRWDDNDTYLCARQSQGFASTFGVGLLFDRVGNDLYRAGGRYLHRPLLPHDFQALSQGFSIGFRPRAGGGVGILMDEEGNDFYDAEVYAQGASYWYSIGLLSDGAGNDRYLATQYAQGAGIHLAVGSLYDRGGDDHYVCKFGVTQGTAHDLSVGLQIDETGNDYYVVSDGQGMSITNSTAIFIDGQGDDTYATPGVGQGWLTWARGFCGAGIFLDLEGKDTYPKSDPGTFGRDGGIWSSDLFAIGIDLPRDVTLPSESLPEPVLTAADSAMSIPQLYELANIWEVGSAREKVRRARKALIERGMEAVRYCLAEGLDTQDGLVFRNLSEVGKTYPDSFAALLLPRLGDPDIWVQRNTIGLLGELKRKEAREPLEAMLRDPRQEQHRNRVIQALGNIGESAARPAIRPFLRDPKERRRITAVVALAALKDTLSLSTFAGLLDDPELTVRSAASNALAGFREAAVSALVTAEGPGGAGALGTARGADEVLRLRTLGRIAVALKDSTGQVPVQARGLARRALLTALDPPHADPAARCAGVEALLGLGDPETAERVRLLMLDETDPMVRRTWERGEERRETGRR